MIHYYVIIFTEDLTWPLLSLTLITPNHYMSTCLPWRWRETRTSPCRRRAGRPATGGPGSASYSAYSIIIIIILIITIITIIIITCPASPGCSGGSRGCPGRRPGPGWRSGLPRQRYTISGGSCLQDIYFPISALFCLFYWYQTIKLR